MDGLTSTARYGVPESLADLENNHKIVGYFSAATGEVWPMRFRNRGSEKHIIRYDIAANDSASLINMLTCGLGVGQTHASVADRFLRSGQLVTILNEMTNLRIPISIIYPPTQQLNVRLRLFIDWVAEHFSAFN